MYFCFLDLYFYDIIWFIVLYYCSKLLFYPCYTIHTQTQTCIVPVTKVRKWCFPASYLNFRSTSQVWASCPSAAGLSSFVLGIQRIFLNYSSYHTTFHGIIALMLSFKFNSLLFNVWFCLLIFLLRQLAVLIDQITASWILLDLPR